MSKTLSAAMIGSATLMVCAAAWAAMPSGRVQTARGGVMTQNGDQTTPIEDGSLLRAGDTVVTTNTGVALWQMSDDSIFGLAPKSGLRINSYVMPNSENRAGKASYTLVGGAFRTITGRIGQQMAAAKPYGDYVLPAAYAHRYNLAFLLRAAINAATPYVVKTAVASVTSSGADYLAAVAPGKMGAKVNKGSIEVCSSSCVSVGAGQSVEVSAGGAPSIVTALDADLAGEMASLDVALGNGGFSVITSIFQPPPQVPPVGCVPTENQSVCIPVGPGLPVSPD